ncbi:DUF4190 domain-containing protein [Actinotalea sp. BY-33]|uniref:DUF4190 domain-containing protein n=1 Tax=Actinotalea soli TaxID=2819234 RepID=A0A939LVD1_9CELL|nr:DUF4190 domain-containing protein [Actinotalea soli]MBO1752809.1 DUF4190 domain-containing protein [Actinotalea soli]
MDQKTPPPGDAEQAPDEQAPDDRGRPQPEHSPQPPPPYDQPPTVQAPYAQQYSSAANRPTNALALISLIASITGLTIFPVVGSIAGVITGHLARRQIAETQEQGNGLALAGLITGYVTIGLALLTVIIAVLFFGVLVTTVGVVGTTTGY